MTDINPELIEKAAIALADDWNPERDPILSAMFRDYAQTALSAVADDLRAEGAAQALREAAVLKAMTEYAEAIRGDWSYFDGRSEKAIILDWVEDLADPKPERDLEWYRRNLDLCMAGGGHWCGSWGHCGEHCGCEPCAADRIEARHE